MNTNAKQIQPASAAEDMVLQEIENGVATLTLNRPKQFNALSEAMLTSLQ
ncbi:MAG: enoyl-CoA hydratase, partial [SAR324 cluster bacterium]|nr:enoyl-CoA hydratase [SAR324 cluster bacterium]